MVMPTSAQHDKLTANSHYKPSSQIPLMVRRIRLLKGEAKKTSLNSQHRFCLISLTKSMLEGWDIIHWKGRIHSFVWSTKTFLYDIWEPRYKQIKIGYQISKCLNIEKFCVWKSDTVAIYA